jgi:hypothetical protein
MSCNLANRDVDLLLLLHGTVRSMMDGLLWLGVCQFSWWRWRGPAVGSAAQRRWLLAVLNRSRVAAVHAELFDGL